jgi:hypothetical protein
LKDLKKPRQSSPKRKLAKKGQETSPQSQSGPELEGTVDSVGQYGSYYSYYSYSYYSYYDYYYSSS